MFEKGIKYSKRVKVLRKLSSNMPVYEWAISLFSPFTSFVVRASFHIFMKQYKMVGRTVPLGKVKFYTEFCRIIAEVTSLKRNNTQGKMCILPSWYLASVKLRVVKIQENPGVYKRRSKFTPDWLDQEFTQPRWYEASSQDAAISRNTQRLFNPLT